MTKLQLFTAPTPNGWKTSIMIEELKAHGADLPEIEVTTVDLMKGEHLSAGFQAMNPNQKIPVLRHEGRSIMESCAIVQYLAERFPTALLPQDERRWDILPWLYWQAANVGPSFGNRQSYVRYLPHVEARDKRHPLERFLKEARRLSQVLETQLTQNDFMCGPHVTVADIVTYPWIRGWKWSKVDMSDRPHILGWLDRMRARPAVARGLAYGAPEGEVDQWSADTKARYAKSGSEISNP